MSRSRKRYPGFSDSNYDICDWRFFEYVDSAKQYIAAKRKNNLPLYFPVARVIEESSDTDLIAEFNRELAK